MWVLVLLFVLVDGSAPPGERRIERVTEEYASKAECDAAQRRWTFTRGSLPQQHRFHARQIACLHRTRLFAEGGQDAGRKASQPFSPE